MESTKLKILFAPLNAWGHILSCAVIGKYLQDNHGHEIIFLTNSAWKEKLSPYGFSEEIYFRKKEISKTVASSSPMQYWTELVNRMEPLMKLSSIEKVKTFGLNTYEDMVSEIMESEEQIESIINLVKPNMILIDNYIISRALLKYSNENHIPWIRLRSASPVEINQTNVPPQNSGFPIKNGDTKKWVEFLKIQEETFAPLWKNFNEWFSNCFAQDILPKGHFIIDSPFLNLYVYPEEIDYLDRRPMPPNWFRIDALLNPCNQVFQLPEEFKKDSTKKIIYMNLGTFGAADLNLMKNIVQLLANYPYKFIISKGPLHEKFELPCNMWGEGVLPQTSILPYVDAVICHGANATMNECFYFGKPILALPFFGDEYDNAQRLEEMGYGIRLDPYNLTEETLRTAIDNLLFDLGLQTRMKCASERIQSSSGVKIAGELIQSLSLISHISAGAKIF